MTGYGQRIDIIMVKTYKSMMKTSLIIVFSVFSLLVFGCKMQVDNIQSGNKGVEGAQDIISFKGKIVYRNFEGYLGQDSTFANNHMYLTALRYAPDDR